MASAQFGPGGAGGGGSQAYYAPYLQSISRPLTPLPRTYSCVGSNPNYPQVR